MQEYYGFQKQDVSTVIFQNDANHPVFFGYGRTRDISFFVTLYWLI